MARAYLYGKQADRFSFIKIPRVILFDKEFAGMSAEAKILYAAMLDRVSLSIQNDWIDDENRVYICFSQENTMAVLSCGKEKATKTIKELLSYDLIRKVRVGQGKFDRIYVMNCESDDPSVTDDYRASSDSFTAGSRSSNIEHSEVRKSNFKKSENRTSRSSKPEHQEVRKANRNKTNMIQTDHIQTQSINPSDETNIAEAPQTPREDGSIDHSQEKHTKLSRVRYDWNQWETALRTKNPEQAKAIDGLLSVIDAVLLEPKEFYVIDKRKVSGSTVTDRLSSLTKADIEAAATGILSRDPAKAIKNQQAYMVAALYNSPASRLASPQQSISFAARRTSFHNFEQRPTAGGSWDELETYRPGPAPETAEEKCDEQKDWEELLASFRTGRKRKQ